MHAIRQHSFGPAENLRYELVDDPRPGPGQVRIAVAVSGVHLIDTAIRSGAGAGPWGQPQLPMIPGREVAGVVDRLGDGVDEAWLGRRVVAHLGPASGGYAELAVREVDELHRLPDGVPDDVAVAMVGTGRTTMGILEVAGLTADDVVLVTAAAGGIGNLIVQAGLAAGATVVGVAGGPDKVERVTALGAHAAVDYRRVGWADEVRATVDGREITVAFDGVGGEVGRGALDLLGIGGRLVLYGWSSGDALELTADDLYAKGMTVTVAIGPRMLRRPGGLRELAERALAAAADGAWTPVINPPFRLSDAAAAHTALENRDTVGKVILVP